MRLRSLLLGLAGLRAILALVAIPLAPFLYKEHFVALVLLRPSKEVLLLAGFLIRRGDVSLLPVVAAALPLALLGVWQFYALGRMYSDEIQEAKLPGLAGRLLPAKRIQRIAGAVEEEGTRLVLLGRMAAFPSTLVAAAAGASGTEPRRFFVADGVGATLSVAEMIAAGYFLGEAYERAGPWLTAVGVLTLLVGVVLLGRRLMGGDAKESALARVRQVKQLRREKGVRAALDSLR